MIGVLVSGNGTNLQALIDEGLPIGAVAANRKDAYALTARATRAFPPRPSASTATPAARSATG
jgi:folate-dependent phosphoribosylglycinamide formyltransferase PurN